MNALSRRKTLSPPQTLLATFAWRLKNRAPALPNMFSEASKALRLVLGEAQTPGWATPEALRGAKRTLELARTLLLEQLATAHAAKAVKAVARRKGNLLLVDTAWELAKLLTMGPVADSAAQYVLTRYALNTAAGFGISQVFDTWAWVMAFDHDTYSAAERRFVAHAATGTVASLSWNMPRYFVDPHAPVGKVVGTCRICRCTDADCHQCIEATGQPCYWVDIECSLCSRCAAAEMKEGLGNWGLVGDAPHPTTPCILS
jgi:hypothetical protein